MNLPFDAARADDTARAALMTYREALIAQIKRDTETLKLDPVMFIDPPGRQFYLDRIATYTVTVKGLP